MKAFVSTIRRVQVLPLVSARTSTIFVFWFADPARGSRVLRPTGNDPFDGDGDRRTGGDVFAGATGLETLP